MIKITGIQEDAIVRVNIEADKPNGDFVTESRYYAQEKDENLVDFIRKACKELENDFSKYENVEIKANWICQPEEILFGKWEDETFENSMFNEWFAYYTRYHRKW